jgi:hypothetical protein
MIAEGSVTEFETDSSKAALYSSMRTAADLAESASEKGLRL